MRRRMNDAFFERAFQVNPDPMTLSSLGDGILRDANAAFLRVFGYARDEVVGRSATDLNLWVDAKRDRARLLAALDDRGTAQGIEIPFRTSSGEVRIFRVGAAIIEDPVEPMLLMVGTDLTEHRRLEAALSASEARYRQLVDDLPLGVLITQHGIIKYANPAMHGLAGYPNGSLTGKPFEPLVFEGDRPWVNDLHRRRMRGEPIPNNYECRYVTLSGEVRHVRLVTRTIDWDGPVSHGVVTDITELVRTEEALRLAKSAAEEANAAKSRFLAAASHDLRQPIQAIGLFLDTLRRTALDSRQLAIARNLTASSQALGELLDALLDISKLDAGIVKPQPELIDLFEIFQRLENECAPLAQERKLRFKLFFPQRLVVFRCDRDLLLVILRNLVGNALRYTETGGVLVGVRLRRDRLLFQVWDTGIGIAPEHQTRLYDEFYQVANPQRERTRGLGLGLSIVKRLAELLGCTIACRSLPGRGSVFEVGVPMGDAPQLHVGTPPSEAHVPASADDEALLAGRRVVLIEDDALVADAMAGWLESMGARADVFHDAETALADPAIVAADLYVSDLRLPGDIDGSALLTQIRDRAGRPLKGIIITGDTSAEQIDRLAACEWRILHKPLDPDRLLAAVAALG